MSMGHHKRVNLQDEVIRKALRKAKSAYDRAENNRKKYTIENTFKKYTGFLLSSYTIRRYIEKLDEEEKAMRGVAK